MPKDGPISNVALIVILTLVVCVAWTLLTGQYWFWIPVIAAFIVAAWMRRMLR